MTRSRQHGQYDQQHPTIPPTKVVLFIKYLLTGSIATRARDPTTRLGITYRKFGTDGPIAVSARKLFASNGIRPGKRRG
jgi:hypothetical protein